MKLGDAIRLRDLSLKTALKERFGESAAIDEIFEQTESDFPGDLEVSVGDELAKKIMDRLEADI